MITVRTRKEVEDSEKEKGVKAQAPKLRKAYADVSLIQHNDCLGITMKSSDQNQKTEKMGYNKQNP